MTSTALPVASSNAFMTSRTAGEQPATATSTSDDSRQKSGDRRDPTMYAARMPSGSRRAVKVRRARRSSSACSAASRCRRARPALSLMLVSNTAVAPSLASPPTPPRGAQAGNGGMRGPGVLKVISVMALTLRLP